MLTYDYRGEGVAQKMITSAERGGHHKFTKKIILALKYEYFT